MVGVDEKKMRLGFRAAFLSLLLNIVLFALKFAASFLSGSVALMADAWHTLSDSLTSIVVIVGLKVSSQPPDERHEFGHGRAEVVASLVIGVLLSVVAFNFVVEGIRVLLGEKSASFGLFALVVVVVSVIVKEALALYCFFVAKTIDSKSIRADGWHHQSDALSSLVVLFGIVLSPFFWWMDGVLTIGISALIFYVTYGILVDAVDSLLGTAPDEEFEKKILAVVSNLFDEEVFPHHLHMHRYGDHIELTLHIKLPEKLSIGEGHGVASKIEDALRQKLDVEATIHVEPLSSVCQHEDESDCRIS